MVSLAIVSRGLDMAYDFSEWGEDRLAVYPWLKKDMSQLGALRAIGGAINEGKLGFKLWRDAYAAFCVASGHLNLLTYLEAELSTSDRVQKLLVTLYSASEPTEAAPARFWIRSPSAMVTALDRMAEYSRAVKARKEGGK